MQSKQDNIDLILNDIKSNLAKDDGFSHANLEFTIASGDDDTVDIESKADSDKNPEIKNDSNKPTQDNKAAVADKKILTESSAKNQKESEKKDDAARVWTTYVPRFTEASDSYRMADSKSPKQDVSVKKSEVKNTQEELTPVNPTAEVEEGERIVDAKIVNVSVPMPETFEMQTKVFKFEDASKDENGAMEESVPTEEELIDKAFVDSEESEDDIPEETETEVQEQQVKEYTIDSIPDPVAFEKVDGALVRVDKNVVLPVAENIGDPISEEKNEKSEYSSFAGRDNFKDRFLDTIMSVRLRLVVAVLISLVIACFEALVTFGVDLSAKLGFSAVNGSLAIIESMLISGLFIIALPEIFTAFKRLSAAHVVPELFVPLGYVVLMAYNLTVANKPVQNHSLFGFLFAIMVVSAIVAELFKKSADFSSFKMISGVGEKKVVDKKLTRTLPEESLAVDGKVEGYKSKMARVFRTAFVADFFKRSKKCSENSANILIIFAVAFGVSLVASSVAFFLLDGIVSLLNTFAAVFMLSVPSLSILSHKIPFYYAQKEAVSENGAVIGEVSLYEYSGVDVIAFNDTEVFGDEDVNLQRIMLYGRSENLTKALYQMSALFSVVGGPLDHIFADSLDHRATPAQNVKVEEDGICGVVSGKNVFAGTLEFMQRNGINVPHDPTPDNATLLSTKIMYAAEDGETYAKFYVRYTLSEEFTMILPSLSDEGVTPLIYTRDPNINGELLKILTAGSDTIRVLKKTNLPVGEDRIYNKISAGIVTTGEKTNVINTLLLCKKYTRFQSRIAVTELLSTVVGATLAIVLALSGITVFPAVILGAWQLAWSAVLWFISNRTFNPISNKESK